MVNYPSDWEVKKLGDIGEWESGSTPSRNNPAYYKNGKIFWIKNTDLNDDFLKSSEEKITEKALKENFLKIKKPGTILIAMYCGETVGKLSILDINATTNQNCCACELYDGFYNKFIFYSLLFRRKEIQGLSLFGGLAHISKKIIINYSIPLPPLTEQQVIADTLMAFDTHITNLAALIDKKKAIRDGALGDLVSGRTRLTGFTEKWEKAKIGECAEIYQGGTPSTTNARYWGGSVIWVTPSEITKLTTIYIDDSERKITKEGLQNSSARLLPAGTILLCTRATIGDLAIAKKPMTTNQGFKNLVCMKNIHNVYFAYLLQTLKETMISLAIGTTFLEISKKNLSAIEITVPSYLEQKAIADVLTAMDDEIKALEDERNKIIQIREGAMDDLLTGRVRLSV